MACVFTFNGDNPATTALLTPDTYVTATHSGKSQLTKFPIEDGSKISDHVINDPRGLQIEWIVSTIGDDQTVQPPHSTDRPRIVWEALASARINKTPFRADVGAESYAVAFITEIARTEAVENGDSYKITMTVEEATISNAKTAPALKLKTGLKHGGKKQDNGNQPVYKLLGTSAVAARQTLAEFNDAVPGIIDFPGEVP
jgi:hypothetical protein